MPKLLAIVLTMILCGAFYRIFLHGTMNRIQMFPWWNLDNGSRRRLYWYTSNVTSNGPRFGKGFMRFTAWPWMEGRSVCVRYGKWTTHVGIARTQPELSADPDDTFEPLLRQLGGRELDVTPSGINKSGDWDVQEDKS